MSEKLLDSAVENTNNALDTVMRINQASVSFGDLNVLNKIDLEINPGEFVCVVGPSGSGKTTLLRLLAGLIQPQSGEVLYREKPQIGPAREVAIVFQDYTNALLPWRTAAGNISLALEGGKLSKSEQADRIDELLEKVGLGDHAQRFPSEMSGGMQQRLQIARCLAQNPRVLLMDEPFGALDAMTRQRLQDEILDIVSDTGVTAFFVTHDLEEAIYLGDRIIALEPNPGQINTIFDVDLPRPRDQMTTREMPEFLTLRRALFDFIMQFEQ